MILCFCFVIVFTIVIAIVILLLLHLLFLVDHIRIEIRITGLDSSGVRIQIIVDKGGIVKF